MYIVRYFLQNANTCTNIIIDIKN